MTTATIERSSAVVAEYDSVLDNVEEGLLRLPQVQCPLTHRFCEGVYMREIFMPANTIVIGHVHRRACLNVVMRGRASVLMAGVMHEIIGPCVFESGAGVRKLLLIHEDTVWSNIHATSLTDVDEIENDIYIKSDTFLRHKEQEQFSDMRKVAWNELEGGI